MAGNGGYWLLFLYVSNPAVVGSDGADEWSDLGSFCSLRILCVFYIFSISAVFFFKSQGATAPESLFVRLLE